jgi:hypothetical protein
MHDPIGDTYRAKTSGTYTSTSKGLHAFKKLKCVAANANYGLMLIENIEVLINRGI